MINESSYPSGVYASWLAARLKKNVMVISPTWNVVSIDSEVASDASKPISISFSASVPTAAAVKRNGHL